MDITIWRTSRSTVVRELLDYSTAIFDADGYNVAQSARIPQHLNSMGAALRTLLDRHVDAKSWGPGDVVVTNDPYCGAQHLNDLLVFTPVFHCGERVAYVGALCHHLDVGGMAPGSYAATATEVFQEGLRLPPVRLVEDGNSEPGCLGDHRTERAEAGDHVEGICRANSRASTSARRPWSAWPSAIRRKD